MNQSEFLAITYTTMLLGRFLSSYSDQSKQEQRQRHETIRILISYL